MPDVEVAVTLGTTLVASLSKGEDLFKSEFDDLWNYAVEETGDRAYADTLLAAALAVASERLYCPRRDFSLEPLPSYAPRVLTGV